MTTWFVTRHPGAIEWAARRGIQVDRQVAHLDTDEIAYGDSVIGVLPVHLAARVCALGARYINLSVDLPEHARGRELSADELTQFGASLEAYEVTKAPIWQFEEGQEVTEATRRNAGQFRTDLNA